jgi:hypothetical protein
MRQRHTLLFAYVPANAPCGEIYNFILELGLWTDETASRTDRSSCAQSLWSEDATVHNLLDAGIKKREINIRYVSTPILVLNTLSVQLFLNICLV